MVSLWVCLKEAFIAWRNRKEHDSNVAEQRQLESDKRQGVVFDQSITVNKTLIARVGHLEEQQGKLIEQNFLQAQQIEDHRKRLDDCLEHHTKCEEHTKECEDRLEASERDREQLTERVSSLEAKLQGTK